MSKCTGVQGLIDELAQLDAAGKCWCECVKEDLPKARALAAAGKCLGAAQVAKAGLRRCNGSSQSPSPGDAFAQALSQGMADISASFAEFKLPDL